MISLVGSARSRCLTHGCRWYPHHTSSPPVPTSSECIGGECGSDSGLRSTYDDARVGADRAVESFPKAFSPNTISPPEVKLPPMEKRRMRGSRRVPLPVKLRVHSEIGCVLAQSNLFPPPFSESTPDEMLCGPATTSDDCAGRVRLPTPELESSGAPSEIRFSHVHNSISSERPAQ